MKIPIPLGAKLWVPGYRAGWLKRYAELIDQLNEVVPGLVFGEEDNLPWIEAVNGKLRLRGFWTEPANREVFQLLAPALPAGLQMPWFRLVKDYINRYLYPHMRPDLKPSVRPVEQMFGFHGQHKDAIADMPEKTQSKLAAAFKPAADDVILDCGCFLGFGEVRMAPEIPGGHIYAIEADAICFDILKSNLKTNRIANVTPLNRAVWNSEKDMELETNFAQANSLVSEVSAGKSKQIVRTITVDGLVKQEGLRKLDMLSLTLNGAEPEALQGAQYTLSELRPRIRLAGWYERGGTKIAAITKDILESHGYRVFVGERGNVMALSNR